MKAVRDLTYNQLASIVDQIQQILWFDEDGYADPDLMWDAGTIELVADVMEDADLKPEGVD